MLTLLFAAALAGPGSNFLPGVEGQTGFGAPVPSPDGRLVALTRADRVGLWVLDLSDDSVSEVSTSRGAGFAPVWAGNRLLYKAVTSDGQEAWSWEAGVNRLLDRGDRVGQPVPAGDSVLWTHGDALYQLDGAGLSELPGIGDVDVLASAGDALAWADGRTGQLWLAGAGALRALGITGYRPSFSADGAYLAAESYDGRVVVLRASDGELVAQEWGDHARWAPSGHALLYDRVLTAGDVGPEAGESPYGVLESTLYRLDLDLGRTMALETPAGLHPRYPAALPDGRVLFVDTSDGALWLSDGGMVSRLLPSPPEATAPAAPPPAYETHAVDLPYMHQLWDTPDNFDGGWSCGAASCVQTVARYQALPRADIGVSWPYAHTSTHGWYIPNAYSFNGYTYDTWGVAKSADCQGSHGFICLSYGGALWAQMVSFLNQHGVGSAYAITSLESVVNETNAGYSMIASTSVLGYGHIIAVRGYLSSGGSPIHTLVVNDPYGNAGSGDWGNFDGAGVGYDWPGYNNGYLEIGISQLFSAHGTMPVVEEPPVEEEPVGEEPVEEEPVADEEPADHGPGPAPYDEGGRSPRPGAAVPWDDVAACSAGARASVLASLAASLVAARRRQTALWRVGLEVNAKVQPVPQPRG